MCARLLLTGVVAGFVLVCHRRGVLVVASCGDLLNWRSTFTCCVFLTCRVLAKVLTTEIVDRDSILYE